MNFWKWIMCKEVYMKYLKIVLMCVITVLVLIMPDTWAYARNNDMTRMKDFRLNQSNNGGNISLKRLDNSNYELNFDTENLDEGYYTAYLYSLGNTNWSKYAGICFYMKNEGSTQANININAKVGSNKVLTVKDEDSIFIKEEGSSYLKRLHPQYGTVQIEAGFEGIVYIPFNSLSNKSISNIESWGLIVTSKENDKKKIIFGDFNFIDSNSSLKKNFNSRYSLKGDAEVQIPTVGQSISDYEFVDNKTKSNISDTGTKVEYFVDEDEKGISIDQNGRLTVTSDAEEKTVKLYASINDEVIEEFRVRLFKSWTLSASEVDGTLKSIPQESEINNLSAVRAKFFGKESVVIAFRVFCILILTGIVGFYCMWNKQEREK